MENICQQIGASVIEIREDEGGSQNIHQLHFIWIARIVRGSA